MNRDGGGDRGIRSVGGRGYNWYRYWKIVQSHTVNVWGCVSDIISHYINLNLITGGY